MELSEFLVKAKIQTYASQGEGEEMTLSDGSKQFLFSGDGWEYRDHYFGSQPFLGEELVMKSGKPAWGMNYYGYLISISVDPKPVYQFLKECLRQVSIDAPFRGPNSYERNPWKYRNDYTGAVERFEGTEEIEFNNQRVYKLFYHGGSVN